MMKSIPLSSLSVSPRNVRRTSDPAADAQLAADIAARGLLQNLVVTPAKPKGTYAVEAGGRRLRALQSLQSDGALPADHTVACLVVGEGSADTLVASEASLAENLQRLAMNPADECRAFGRLIDDGADVEGVARRFGLTVRHVEARLRLAGLHPTVFEALGAGEITLDAAKAYAATSDQERQLWVFEQLHTSWSGAHPDSIRRMMVSATVPASDHRMKFVGEEVYLAAGGRIERDLFADADDARVLDVQILEQLATDKLEVEAAWLANEHGYAFVCATLDTYVQPWRHEDLQRALLTLPEPSEEDQRRIEAIEAQIDTLAEALEDPDGEDFARDEAETRIAELEAELRTIASKPPVLDPEVRGTVGFFLLLDDAGEPRLDPTPYALVGDEVDEDDARGHGADSEGVPTGETNAGGPRVDPGTTGEPRAAIGALAQAKLSQRLLDELAMQRRDILSLNLAADPALAFDLAVFLMVKDEGGHCYGNVGSSLTARPPSDPVLRSTMPEAQVNAALAEADAALDRSWAGFDDPAQKFAAFRALPREAREAWLGAAVARTLEASVGTGGRTCAFHDQLGALLGIDVARHWRPTAINWFDRVPKALCMSALNEVGGPELAARHAKGKKAELAEACEKVFSGDAILDAEVKAAALAWVPEPMRFAPAEPTDSAPPWSQDDTGDDGAETEIAPDGFVGAEQVEPVAIAASDEDAAQPLAKRDDVPGGEGEQDGLTRPHTGTCSPSDGNDAAAAVEEAEAGNGADAEPVPAACAAKPGRKTRVRRKPRAATAALDKAA